MIGLKNPSNMEQIVNARVPTREEVGLGKFWQPISHGELVTEILSGCSRNGIGIEDQRFKLCRKDLGLVGVIQTDRAIKEIGGVKASFGFRHSLDGHWAIHLVAGATVLACTNGMIAGEMIVLKQMHTRNTLQSASFREQIDAGLQCFVRKAENIEGKIRAMKDVPVSRPMGNDFINEMFTRETIPLKTLKGSVLNWNRGGNKYQFNPAKATTWDLLNSVTEAVQELSPAEQFDYLYKVQGAVERGFRVAGPEGIN